MTPEDAASIEFAENPEPRCACVLLLDTSGSMGMPSNAPPINDLNQALSEFKKALSNDAQASARVEVAIVTFGNGGVKLAQDFVSAGDYIYSPLIAGGDTPLGDGLNLALDIIAGRKSSYKANDIDYYRPWIILITDGGPNNDGVWQPAAARLRTEEERKGVLCWCFGVEGANATVLEQISPERAYVLKEYTGSFAKIFQWVSSSMDLVSKSTPGDQVPLMAPPGKRIVISS